MRVLADHVGVTWIQSTSVFCTEESLSQAEKEEKWMLLCALRFVCDFGVVGVDVGCKEEVGYWGVSAGGGVGVLLK